MNKPLKYYILFIVFTFAAMTAFSGDDGDILNQYIGEFFAKADAADDQLLSLLSGDSSQPVSIESEKDEPGSITAEPNELAEDRHAVSQKLRKELRDSALVTLPAVPRSDIDTQLREVINQLKSLQLADKTKNETEVISSTGPAEEPETVIINRSAVESNENKTVTPSLVQQVAQSGTVFIDANLASIVDVFALAESLFHAGDKTNALIYYRKALEKCTLIESMQNPQRAWVLFQIGNCLYDADRDAAIKTYQQLISEHASSDWTNCARTKLEVLKWLVTEKPFTLTGSVISD